MSYLSLLIDSLFLIIHLPAPNIYHFQYSFISLSPEYIHYYNHTRIQIKNWSDAADAAPLQFSIQGLF